MPVGSENPAGKICPRQREHRSAQGTNGAENIGDHEARLGSQRRPQGQQTLYVGVRTVSKRIRWDQVPTTAGSGVQGEDQRSAQCSHGHGKDVEVSTWAIIPFLPSCHHRTQKLTPLGSGAILVRKMGREDTF